MYGQSSGSDPVIDSLEQLLAKQKPDTAKLRTYYKLVQLWCDNDARKALTYANEMADLSDSVGSKKGKARALNGLGNIYLNQGDYQKALFSFLQSLRIYELVGDTQSMAAIFNCMGNVYSRLKRFETSSEYYQTAIQLYRRKGSRHTKDLGQCYANLGSVIIELGQKQRGLAYYDTGLVEAIINNNTYGKCIIWVGKSEAYFQMKEDKKTEEYLLMALEGNCNPHTTAFAEQMLGQVYNRQNKWDEALVHLKKGLAMAKSSGVDYMLPIIYKAMSESYKNKGDHKESLRYYEMYHGLSESIVNSDKLRKMAELQSAYEVEKRDRQIESLDNEMKVAELQSTKDRLYRNSFIIAFMLAAITSVAFIRNTYLKQKVNRILNENNTALNEKNRQIESQKSEIEKINLELDKYNKEVVKENIIAKYEILKGKTNPHFLFNSLTSLSALVIRDKESALEFIEHFSELYRMILEMGDNRLISLKQEMELVKNYLYLEKARFRDNLIIDIRVEESLNDLLLPSFAIQICVENALKHNTVSEAQKLTVSVHSEDRYILICNNLQRKNAGVISTATGQKNIIERYRLITELTPVFKETETEYLVKLPLLPKEQRLEI
jgi:tetratricopeptide (TPR) repeat protein